MTTSDPLMPRSIGDPGLSRCIAHLKALGFQVEPRPQGRGFWMVGLPGDRGVATVLEQRALKTLARACRHFRP